jgi:hypothetical protein
MYRYLQTLIKRPDLADCLKFLRWDYSVLANPKLFQSYSTEVEDCLRRYQEKFAMESASAIQDLRGGGELADALLVPALMHAPNLEELHIVDKFYGDGIRTTRRWLEPIRLGTPHTFKSLRSADITMACMNSDDIVTILQIPTLR